jgi:Uma2 family endonuclease
MSVKQGISAGAKLMSLVAHPPEVESPPQRRLFTVEEYLTMAEAGIFTADERVQLINGEIVRMSPMGRLHRKIMAIVSALLNERLVARNAVVVSQLPLEVPGDSMPEPDFMVFDRSLLGMRSFPKGSDLILAIEVADSSLKIDKGVKVSLYARAGIREYWVVDLQDRTIEVYRKPVTMSGTYGEVTTRGVGEKVALESHPDVEFAVADFSGENPASPE